MVSTRTVDNTKPVNITPLSMRRFVSPTAKPHKGELAQGCVATIGAFDGVHRGHQALLKQVVSLSEEHELRAVAVIFEPQPYEYFSPDNAPPRLMRLREKVLALFASGMHEVVCLRFNHALCVLPPEQFITQVLRDTLAVKRLVVGDDFRFGQARKGDFALLNRMASTCGYSVIDTHTQHDDVYDTASNHALDQHQTSKTADADSTVDTDSMVNIDNSTDTNATRISSTLIRQLLEQGELRHATAILGKPYALIGRVGYGKQLGRTIGFPTANVHLGRARPALSGVFAVTVTTVNATYNAVANIGMRPTLGDIAKPLLEAHILDAPSTLNLYGQCVTVAFKEKIRNEQKFDSLAQLQAQIQRDTQQAIAFFNPTFKN